MPKKTRMDDRNDSRRPGRPRLARDDQSVPVHVKLPSRQYDTLFERAQRERVSVPELIRRKLSSTDDDEY